jgi:hypothetical protein
MRDVESRRQYFFKTNGREFVTNQKKENDDKQTEKN